MQVRAIQDGFFRNSRVRAGTVFEVPEGMKGKWFEPVGLAKPAAVKAEVSPSTFSELNAAEEASTPKSATVKKVMTSKNPAKADDTLV